MKAVRTGITIGLAMATIAPALAGVRAVHASPDTPAVDVIVNDNFAMPAFTNAPFTGVTPYAALPTGSYNFKVVPTGQMAPVPINADVAIDGATDYSIVAADTFASITPLVFEDDNTIANGQARVRLLHLSPNAPNVDVGLAGGGPILFSNVAFTESGGYQTVNPGTYDLDVLVAGTSTVALPVRGLTLEANTVYTVYAMGLLNNLDTPLQAIVSVDAVPEPSALLMLALAGAGLIRRR